MKPKPKDITFHYTNEQMVKDLISITPISGSVLDAGSGKNKVWFNNPQKNPIKCDKPKFDRLTSKEIAPEMFGKLTRQERRAITPKGFAEAFFWANQ